MEEVWTPPPQTPPLATPLMSDHSPSSTQLSSTQLNSVSWPVELNGVECCIMNYQFSNLTQLNSVASWVGWSWVQQDEWSLFHLNSFGSWVDLAAMITPLFVASTNHKTLKKLFVNQYSLGMLTRLEKISRYRELKFSLSRISNRAIRDVPNIRFVFASVPNSGPNSLFVFGRIASS